MRTRSQSRNLDRQQQQAPPAFVEPFNLEEPSENPAPPVVPMADNRTMAQLLQAPTEGFSPDLLEKEAPRSMFDMGRSCFQNSLSQFFHPSKTTTSEMKARDFHNDLTNVLTRLGSI
ncbi:hypothetical protein Tco_1154305 [Tanacetum coccineum]